jgi:hypothetical protein
MKKTFLNKVFFTKTRLKSFVMGSLGFFLCASPSLQAMDINGEELISRIKKLGIYKTPARPTTYIHFEGLLPLYEARYDQNLCPNTYPKIGEREVDFKIIDAVKQAHNVSLVMRHHPLMPPPPLSAEQQTFSRLWTMHFKSDDFDPAMPSMPFSFTENNPLVVTFNAEGKIQALSQHGTGFSHPLPQVSFHWSNAQISSVHWEMGTLGAEDGIRVKNHNYSVKLFDTDGAIEKKFMSINVRFLDSDKGTKPKIVREIVYNNGERFDLP